MDRVGERAGSNGIWLNFSGILWMPFDTRKYVILRFRCRCARIEMKRRNIIKSDKNERLHKMNTLTASLSFFIYSLRSEVSKQTSTVHEFRIELIKNVLREISFTFQFFAFWHEQSNTITHRVHCALCIGTEIVEQFGLSDVNFRARCKSLNFIGHRIFLCAFCWFYEDNFYDARKRWGENNKNFEMTESNEKVNYSIGFDFPANQNSSALCRR